MGSIGQTIASCARLTSGLAEMLAKDIDPAIFAIRPFIDGREVQTNHPAFVYGHLALYPVDALKVCGLEVPALKPPEAWVSLFQHGCECRNDPDCSIYPAKDELVSAFINWTNTALDALAAVDDPALKAPNDPASWLAERFTSRGAAVNFYLNSHPMMHLGQVSAWRRCMGLGSVM